ncbi:MAG: glycerophosphoryl diester phosphodiesterase membrane domain-containing protein [Croceibacterium sp.]
MTFDMNRTWTQAISLVRANFQLLAIIAGVFLLLPTLAVYVLNPDFLQIMALAGDPEAMQAKMNSILPGLIGYGTVAFICQMVGYTGMIALIGGNRPTVGQALKQGASAMPTIIGSVIVFFIGFFLAALVVGLALGLVIVLLIFIGSAIGLSVESGGGVIVGIIVGVALYAAVVVAELYVMVRFMMTLPVIVLERQYNPIKALVRSWKVTKPRAWAILGFVLLLFVAYFVIVILAVMLLSALGIVFGGQMSEGSILGFSLVSAVLGAVVAMLFSAILVSMHQQLSGDTAPMADIFA